MLHIYIITGNSIWILKIYISNKRLWNEIKNIILKVNNALQHNLHVYSFRYTYM